MKQLEYTTGATTVQSKEFTEVPGEKIRLVNQHDYLEFLNYSISELIAVISKLNEAVDSLRSDMRQIRVGNEAFVYGEKVTESDEVDQDEITEEKEDA